MIRNSLLALAGILAVLTVGHLPGAEAAPPAPPSVAAPDKVAEAAAPTRLPDEAIMAPTIVTTEVVTQVTGADSPNDTATRWDISGTDLGHMFWHRDSLYMVFGDTFGQPGIFGKNWRSNTLAKIADPDPRNGLPFAGMITAADGKAKELIPSRKIDGLEMTVIPTNGISVGDRMVLDYMSVKHWAATGGVWTVGHSGMAYSDDDGQTWAVPENARWPRGTGFEQVAYVQQDDALYAFGIPEGRFGGARLRRVAPQSILDPASYEYWDGSEWTSDASAAAVVVPAPVGELSVAWSNARRLWVMMYIDPEAHAIVLRTAPQLTGPWGQSRTVVTAEDYPGLYAPFIVPGSDIDSDVFYTMSLWSKYNVFLMRTTLDWGSPAVASVAEQPGSNAVLIETAQQP